MPQKWLDLMAGLVVDPVRSACPWAQALRAARLEVCLPTKPAARSSCQLLQVSAALRRRVCLLTADWDDVMLQRLSPACTLCITPQAEISGPQLCRR